MNYTTSRPKVTADGYIRNHGTTPRGTSSWMFAPATAQTAYWNEVDFTAAVSFFGTFTEARKQAVAHFAEVDGAPRWVAVCP